MIFDFLFFFYLLYSISSLNHPSFHPQSLTIHFPQNVYIPQPVTLEKIFSADHSWTATLSAQKIIRITAVGDIMLGREITSKNLNADFNYLYASTSGLLASADLTIANLESPITPDCKPFSTGMVFCAPTAHLKPLAASGIDLLGLGNNHAYDQGEIGFEQTVNLLSQSGLNAVLPNNPYYTKIKDVNFAFIAFSFIPGRRQITPSDSQIMKIISEASTKADLVIVLPHWGQEYVFKPDREQTRLAHLMIDSGADLILGSHPHWIQPLEIYKQKLIVHSHGNFIFDQFWSQKTREGIIASYIFHSQGLVDVEFVPVFISLDGHPSISPASR